MVRREREDRQIGEPAGPVGQLASRLRLQNVALPLHVVGELELQIWQRRSLTPLESRIENAQLVREDLQRPAVGDNVMDDQQEQEVRVVELDQRCPKQRRARQIKRCLGVGGSPSHRLGLAGFGRQMAQVDDGAWQFQRGCDALHRAAVKIGEAGAQNLVAPDHFVERPTHGVDVDGDIEAGSQIDRVEGTVRREPVQKPEPLLCGRQRCGPLRRDSRHSRQVVQAQPFDELALLGRRAVEALSQRRNGFELTLHVVPPSRFALRSARVVEPPRDGGNIVGQRAYKCFTLLIDEQAISCKQLDTEAALRVHAPADDVVEDDHPGRRGRRTP